MMYYHDWNELRKKQKTIEEERMGNLQEFNDGLNVVRLLPNSTVSDEETSMETN